MTDTRLTLSDYITDMGHSSGNIPVVKARECFRAFQQTIMRWCPFEDTKKTMMCREHVLTLFEDAVGTPLAQSNHSQQSSVDKHAERKPSVQFGDTAGSPTEQTKPTSQVTGYNRTVPVESGVSPDVEAVRDKTAPADTKGGQA